MMNLHAQFIEEIESYNDCRFDGLIDALSMSPSVSVRANKLKGVEVPIGVKSVKWCDNGWYLPSRQSFTFDPSLHQGLYYVQDASSMIISYIVSQLIGDSKEPICYLDACAAPGGKTTTAIDIIPKGSLVVANEYVSNRANILVENIVKWGYPSIVISRGDTSKYKKLRGVFDIIAADVPCSGEGMFRKDSEAVKQWSPDLVEECVNRQKEIVSNLWNSLRQGGYMIYSTCTFNRRENEEMIDFIINELGAESVKIDIPHECGIQTGVNTTNYCYRFLPHKVEGEGLFVAVVRKGGSEDIKTQKCIKNSKKKNHVKSANISAVENWICDEYNEYEFVIDKDNIIAFPSRWNDYISLLKSNLDVIYYGINIATIKGRDIIPLQSLSMSHILNKNSFIQAEVDYSTAISYLRREAIMLEDYPKGYILITYKKQPLGFVKNLGNRANNLYPNEWRILSSHLPDEIPNIIS